MGADLTVREVAELSLGDELRRMVPPEPDEYLEPLLLLTLTAGAGRAARAVRDRITAEVPAVHLPELGEALAVSLAALGALAALAELDLDGEYRSLRAKLNARRIT